MYFDSTVYIVFLALVVLLYWRLRHRSQNVMLLCRELLLLRLVGLALSCFDDDVSHGGLSAWTKDADTANTALRRSFLTFSIILNFAVLGFFKYFDFFAHSTLDALAALGIHSVSLPLLHVICPGNIFLHFPGGRLHR